MIRKKYFLFFIVMALVLSLFYVVVPENLRNNTLYLTMLVIFFAVSLCFVSTNMIFDQKNIESKAFPFFSILPFIAVIYLLSAVGGVVIFFLDVNHHVILTYNAIALLTYAISASTFLFFANRSAASCEKEVILSDFYNTMLTNLEMVRFHVQNSSLLGDTSIYQSLSSLLDDAKYSGRVSTRASVDIEKIIIKRVDSVCAKIDSCTEDNKSSTITQIINDINEITGMISIRNKTANRTR